MFAHDGDFARPVPVRVPLAQEGKVGIGLEHGVGVLLVHFGDGEDVRIFSFDVQPEPKLGGRVLFRSVRAKFCFRLKGSFARFTFHFSALQDRSPATFQVAICVVPLGSLKKASGLSGRVPGPFRARLVARWRSSSSSCGLDLVVIEWARALKPESTEVILECGGAEIEASELSRRQA